MDMGNQKHSSTLMDTLKPPQTGDSPPPSHGDGEIGTIRVGLPDNIPSPNVNTVVVNPSSPQITVIGELLSLLKWSMLAACTIGPGTVVVCSKSGADFQLQLIWTLVAASFVAFTLQKEAARLTMESGKSFGRMIREHFGEGAVAVPKIGYIMSVGVFIGNTAYEANNFAGAMGGLYELYQNVAWFRVIMTFILGGATLAALLFGNVDKLGQLLGFIVLAMTIIFLITASKVPPIYEAHESVNPNITLEHRDFGADLVNGFLPGIPDGASVTVLSMMATTAIPFNTFLAASMSDLAVSPSQMKRGVAFSTFLAMIISILVVIIGSAITKDTDDDFHVSDLAQVIGHTMGEGAKVLFCIGLYAAAYSSAITCPLGAALTIQQIFYEGRGGDGTITEKTMAMPNDTDSSYAVDPVKSGDANMIDSGLERVTSLASVSLTSDGEEEIDSGIKDDFNARSRQWATTNPNVGVPIADERWNTGGKYFKATMIISVSVAILTSSAGLPVIGVIFTAQVINGLLLPLVAACLFICLNDAKLMPRTLSTLDNIPMLITVFVTMFLSSHLILDEISTAGGGHLWPSNISIGLACAIGAVGTTILAILTLPCYGARRLLGIQSTSYHALTIEMAPL